MEINNTEIQEIVKEKEDNRIKERWEELTSWVRNNKKVLLHLAFDTALLVGCGILFTDNVKLKEKTNELYMQNSRLLGDNMRLHVLIQEKDAVSKTIFSDGLRYGSPLCGRALSDLNQYYKSAQNQM